MATATTTNLKLPLPTSAGTTRLIDDWTSAMQTLETWYTNYTTFTGATSGHTHDGTAGEGPKILWANINPAIAQVSTTAANTTKNKLVSNTLAKGWEDHKDNSGTYKHFPTSPAQGNIVYYGTSAWTKLAPGTAGQALRTGGASANVTWGNFGEKSASNTWTKNQAVTPVALTSATAIATDASLSNVFTLTLVHNATLSNPSNLKSGSTYIWVVTQGTAVKTLDYGTNFLFSGGTHPTLTASAGAVDVISGVYIATGKLYCSIIQDVK